MEDKRGVEFCESARNAFIIRQKVGVFDEQTECHNTRLPLPTLLCAGYSELKLIFLFIYKVYVKKEKSSMFNYFQIGFFS